jgi:3',5'-nucleoside bisphosphate phosphatase
MAVDLHVHSNASDGSDPPAAVVRLAAEAGLSAIALTDHDTLEGIPEAKAAAEKTGIELVPGTEISLDWDRGAMHMVVLFLEPGPGPLQDRMSALQEGRASRNLRMVERLQLMGFDITLEEVLMESGQGSAGRPHIAAILVRKGYVPDISTAFDQLLGSGRPAYLGRPRLTPEEAIKLAQASGAVTVLAHPHTTGLDTAAEVAELLEQLRAAGLTGMECDYGAYLPELRLGYRALARRFQLIPSGGSDYHGAYKAGVFLGVGRGDLLVPADALEELRRVKG